MPRPPVTPSLWCPLTLREKADDTSGEDNDEKEAVASRGRKTANSQGRRKGRITRSMANEANSEEAVTPQQSAELGESPPRLQRPAVGPGATALASLCAAVASSHGPAPPGPRVSVGEGPAAAGGAWRGLRGRLPARPP